MDKLLEWFARPGIVVLIVTFVWTTYVVRSILETAMPRLKQSATGLPTVWVLANLWWNKVVLEALPMLLAVLISWSDNEFLFGSIKTYQTRFLFAAAVAYVSAIVFKVGKLVIARHFGVKISGDGTAAEVVEDKKDVV